MFVKSFKLSTRRLAGAGILFLAVLLLTAYGVGARITREASAVEAGAKEVPKAEKCVAKTNRQRLAFAAELGWQTQEEPEEITEVLIPEEFDAVYEQYNTLQKEQGYQLEAYRGKRCKRYSYCVTNYPKQPQHVRLNLLVADGKIIGGDVSSTEEGGFLHGFVAPTQATMAEALAEMEKKPLAQNSLPQPPPTPGAMPID